jgi:hypothetical protein
MSGGGLETEAGEAAAPVAARTGPGATEWAAIAMLLFGGFIVPVAGWVLGLVLLWISSAWTTRDKLIGTFLLPGGLLAPFLVLALASPVTLRVSPLVAALLLTLLSVVPIWTAVYLARHARRSDRTQSG